MQQRKPFLIVLPSAAVLALAMASCGDDEGESSVPGVQCTPSQEVCNQRDDDCNGLIDDGLNLQVEVCNQIDDNCNGIVDEGLNCTCTPVAEVCNGLDDDCDGRADIGANGAALEQDCSNTCGIGTEVCVNGLWVNCTAPQSTAEVCNGVDDDCDGLVDEDSPCAVGAQQNCGTDIGVCAYGTQLCGQDCTWGACLGGTQPAGQEICDGTRDDDCDGTVDNGCGCTDGQTQECCGGSTITCSAGVMPNCPPPPGEVCNGADDDCNGRVDDALPVDPYLIDEHITGVDSCANAKLLPSVTEGDFQPAVHTYYLYKSDVSPDRDFFHFKAVETWDICLPPDANECYTITVKLVGEPGTSDYEFCLYDIGYAAIPSGTCAQPVQKICSTDAGQTRNEVTMPWDGDCIFSDDRLFYLEVFSVTGATQTCEPYTFTIEMPFTEPQDPECPFVTP